MTSVETSVVIPHYNDLAALDRCLTALARQTVSQDQYEIVVADNGSPIGLEAVREAIAGRARLVEVLAKGAGPARNGGVAAAAGQILAFTDSDCLPEPGWLAAGIEALGRGQIVGGGMKVLVDKPDAPTAAEAFEMIFAFDNADYVLRKHFSVTANLFVRRDDFLRVGGFRVGVSEDLEWCLRARSLGLRIVYEPDSLVGHPARRDWAELRKKWQRLVLERYNVTKERRFGLVRWLARTWLLPISILADLPKVMTSAKLPTCRCRAQAVGILIALRLWRFIEGHRVVLAR